MVDIEDLTEEELDKLHIYYTLISDLARRELDIHQSHSIDAAEDLHQRKRHVRSKLSDEQPKSKSGTKSK